MFDPNIKIRVIADFKYKDEVFVNAQTYLSFDIYDSTKIAELVSLYNPSYSHKEFIELPSLDSLPFHIKEQIRVTYSLDKPKDQDYTPVENKPFYETLGDSTFSPFGASPSERDTTYDPPKPLADNTYEAIVVEPKFPTLADVTIEPSVAESEPKEDKQTEDIQSSVVEEKNYSEATLSLLKLNESQLLEKPAAELKKAILELDKDYDYTNKAEAVKHIITFK